MTNFLNSEEFKLNLSTLIIYKSKSYAFFKRISPWYWYTRPMTKFMIKNYSKNKLIGVEIGVEYGLNAKTILRFLPIEKLYLIDPYTGKSGDSIFKEAKKFLKKFNSKIEFIRKTSEEAIKEIPNNLDFVYIDGNHNYEDVKRDIELYYIKVKKNGIIGGHDFWANQIGVCKAVLDFVSHNNLKLHGNLTDWWILK